MKERKFLLDAILKQRGFSVAEFARMSGMSRSTIDDIRSKNGAGRRENVEKIALALGLEYDELFELESEDEQAVTTSTPSVDAEQLRRVAEGYREDGDDEMYRRLMASARKAGISVETILDKADRLYKDNDPDAIKEYNYAFSSAKPRHLPRMKLSVQRFLSLCEDANNLQPALTLYNRMQEPGFEDYDMFFWLGTFFAETRQPSKLITDCFDLADKLADRLID